MPLRINNQIYYRTAEICKLVGVSRSTLFRWVRAGILNDVVDRDRRGWRLFSKTDIERIKEEAFKISCLDRHNA